MARKIKTAKHHTDLPKPSYPLTVADMTRESDRGCAIVGTAYLDILLRSAIEHQMRQMPDLHAKLFENRGALADFSARIMVAYAFKVIGNGAFADLSIMRDIRNAFAHAAEALSFDREDIAGLCGALWYPLNIGRTEKPNPTGPRDIFVRGVEHLADGLLTATHPELSKSGFIHLGQAPTPRASTLPKKRKERVRRDHPPNKIDR